MFRFVSSFRIFLLLAVDAAEKDELFERVLRNSRRSPYVRFSLIIHTYYVFLFFSLRSADDKR